MRIMASGNARVLTKPTEADLWARLADTAWDDMVNWECLVWYLYQHGPNTTGVLGHVYGIGENVRGIRREADRALAKYGLYIKSHKTEGLPNATYRLASLALRKALQRTEAVLAEAQRELGL